MATRAARSIGWAVLAATTALVGGIVLVSCDSTPPNQPPTATLTTAPAEAVISSSVPVAGTATDPDGSVAKVVFSLGADSVGDTSAPFQATLHAPSTPGTYQIAMTATDDRGASTTAHASLRVHLCAANPASALAKAHGVDPTWVSALGADCAVDANETWLIETALPDLLTRTTDAIAHSFTQRFVDDDGAFGSDERLTLLRALYGRTNAKGVLIDRGLFARYDQVVGTADAIAIPNAWWIPTIWTPFTHAVLPSRYNEGYGLPYFPDGAPSAAWSVDLLPWPNDETVFAQLGAAVTPTPDFGIASDNLDMFLDFSEDQEIVNSLPEPVEVTRVEYLNNYGDKGQQVRNVYVHVVPVDRSPSLGFADLEMWVGHLDASRVVVQEGDIIPPEGTLGYTELHLGAGIQVHWGFYSADGQTGAGGHYNGIDVTFPTPDGPRMLLPQVVVRSVDADGAPTQIFYGAFQYAAVKDGLVMTLQGWPPLVYTPPPQP